jgi:hypothetical protein
MKLKNFFNKFALIGSCGFFIIVAIFIGCQKDFTATNFVTTNSSVKSKSVSNYQKWFEAYTNNPENANFAIGKNIKGKIEPIWDKAVQIDPHLLELPFKLNGGGLSQNISKGYKDGKVSLTLRANTNGSYKGFIIAISPKDDFVGSVDNINIYNFKTEKFDGIISIHDLRGKYLDGYFVREGKIMAKSGGNSAQKSKQNSESMKSCCVESCQTFAYEWCTCLCVAWPYVCGGSTCSNPNCEGWDVTICWEDCSGCDNNCPEPQYPLCGDCPDPNNPNCDNCPNPMNPNCDTGGCPNPNDPNCGGGCPDPNNPNCPNPNNNVNEYVCATNFQFSSANENTSIRQEAGISGVNAITKGISVSLPTLYFSAPFHDPNGGIVLSHAGAAGLAAGAINYGEDFMRQKRNAASPVTDPGMLANIWRGAAIDYFMSAGNPNTGIFNPAYQAGTSQMEPHTPIIKSYAPCN